MQEGPATHRHFGGQQERLAEEFLREQGLITIERNFHCRGGEIDLIMRDGTTLVFIEVRYRKHSRFGSAAESVTRTKQQRLLRCARYFMLTREGCQDLPCRFDVMALCPDPGRRPVQYDWIQDAFSGFT